MCDHDTLHCPAAKARCVSLCLSGAKYLSCFIYFSFALHAFILHPLSSTSLPRTGEGQCLPFSLHTVLFLNQACEAWSLPANPPSTIIMPRRPCTLDNTPFPLISSPFPSIFRWLSGPLILNPHVSRWGFNDPGECGSMKRCPAAHVVSAVNLFKYLLNLVLGLWPENVFQINSVKSWMNLLTFVSDNVPWIGSHLSLADFFVDEVLGWIKFSFSF